ncbi:MAG: LLM class flavin-dependent oxidoreductase, partial [Actinobacteria bacterium]|nr:LLM class flavin-dependent oxidoreductase [Actinomycetota bacterium]
MDLNKLRFGLDTFGDTQNDDAGNPISAAQTIRNVIEQGVLADSLGLSNFSVGEHHR